MKINISHVAKLANLTLTDEEKERFTSQLSTVIEYIEKLNEVNTDNIPETSQVTGLENVFREDNLKECLKQKDALSGAKQTYNGLFVVKGILENE
ncbi:MAG: aspartyl/glutamyl-tRNA(Asn/Gln) amidotransferase subunit C [Patescibacteria group bacterium]|nr:MAG: aspartyl/glutamyl-tRNA(Asn/Gln) amidotransferase subunit C [Patescibacteria group bacterium]